jgi:hypothetical protein
MTIIKKHADEITLVLCACGCGQMIRRFTWARERKWVLGHHKRLIFTSIGSAATRTIRAFSLTDKNCYINNEDCHGALQEHISIRTNSTFVKTTLSYYAELITI